MRFYILLVLVSFRQRSLDGFGLPTFDQKCSEALEKEKEGRGRNYGECGSISKSNSSNNNGN